MVSGKNSMISRKISNNPYVFPMFLAVGRGSINSMRRLVLREDRIEDVKEENLKLMAEVF